MKSRSDLIVAIALALACPGLAAADPTAQVASESSTLTLSPSLTPELALTTSGAEAPAQFNAGNVTLESIRYRPRRHRGRDRDRDNDEGSYRGGSHGFSQLHGGFFDPDGELSNGVLFGFKLGSSIEDRVQIGVGADWNHRSDRRSAIIQEVPVPGGGVAERRLELSRSSSDLFPMLLSLQVSPVGGGSISPYFGVGAGYEVLFVSAEDFTTGDEFDATYGGWGWQLYGGLAFPLSNRNRFNAEVFVNNADLERDVEDSGGTFKEIISMDGIGARFGLSWGF